MVPELSVIVVNWNTRGLLAECLRSVIRHRGDLDLELIVVDNASTDGSAAMVRGEFPEAQLIVNSDNIGFARANNQGVAAGRGRFALLLNSDAQLTVGALSALVHLANSRPQAGLVGAQLVNADGSFQASHTPFPTLWREFLILSGLGRVLYGSWYPSKGPDESRGPQPVDYVEGACMLVRRNAYQAVGGLDEDSFIYAEEVDLCYTLRANGWQVWYQPMARVIHLGGGSSRSRRLEREGDLYRSRVRFFRKRYGDRAAGLLKLQLYGFTAIKIAVHGLVRLLSGGRYGRSVVSLHHLATELREV